MHIVKRIKKGWWGDKRPAIAECHYSPLWLKWQRESSRLPELSEDWSLKGGRAVRGRQLLPDEEHQNTLRYFSLSPYQSPIGWNQTESNLQGIPNDAIHRVRLSKTRVFVATCYFSSSTHHSVLCTFSRWLHSWWLWAGFWDYSFVFKFRLSLTSSVTLGEFI